jgi:hypothetical protein
MARHTLIISILLVVGLLGGSVFLFWFLHKEDVTHPDTGNDSPGTYTVTVLEDSFQNNTHVLSGVVRVPTPCHQVIVSNPTVAESYPEQVRIAMTVTVASDVCAQVVTEKPFSVTFNASEKAQVTFIVNSESIIPEYLPGDTTSSLKEENSLEGGKAPALVQ